MIEPLLKNRLTCLRALLLSESGFSRASLPFFSSSDLPIWGLTCGGPLLLSESAASSLFFRQGSFFSYLLWALCKEPRKMALFWPCLPSLGGPSCVRPAPAFYRDWGTGFWLEIFAIPATPSLYKCRCRGPTQKGPPRSGRHGQRMATLCGFALPFEMLVEDTRHVLDTSKQSLIC